MISESLFILLIVLAILSAYATFKYAVPVWIGGPFSAILFALVGLYSGAVYSNMGDSPIVFTYVPIQIFSALCSLLLIVGVFMHIMAHGLDTEEAS
tara:strand:+ start:2023 stop:2310 length:288 start_codon:yes stop_codon:yes gene_type:complete